MPKVINRVGLVFGRLTVLCQVGQTKERKWLCVCECGSKSVIRATNLGRTKSCGCLQASIMDGIKTIHGESPTRKRKCTPEYKAWSHAKGRCYNPKDSRYSDYGGRGIKMCDRWLNSYVAFLEDMGRRPVGRYSLDRINVHGNYDPSNCRWATDKEQANNKRKYKTLFMVN